MQHLKLVEALHADLHQLEGSAIETALDPQHLNDPSLTLEQPPQHKLGGVSPQPPICDIYDFESQYITCIRPQCVFDAQRKLLMQHVLRGR